MVSLLGLLHLRNPAFGFLDIIAGSWSHFDVNQRLEVVKGALINWAHIQWARTIEKGMTRVANFEMISNRSTLQLVRLTTKNIFQTVNIYCIRYITKTINCIQWIFTV